jgi:ABC-type transporter Mla subunit MlaD
MAEKASYTKLGVFVVITTALLMLMLGLLGAGAFLKRTVIVATYFPESVQGLDNGAPVKLRGVTIGKVHNIDLVIGRPVREGEGVTDVRGYVRVDIELDADRFSNRDVAADLAVGVREGLRARVASSNLMGGGYIEIVYVRPDTPYFKPPDDSARFFLPSTPSLMTEFLSAAERIAGQLEAAEIDKVARSMNALMQSLDGKVQELDVNRIQQDARALLSEVRSTNARVKALLEDPAVGKMLDGASRAAADLPELTARLKSVSTKLEEIMADRRTGEMVVNADSAAAAASAAMGELRRVARRLDALLAGNRHDLEATVGALRHTLDNVEYMSQDARQNPSRMLFGEPPPQFVPARGQGERR